MDDSDISDEPISILTHEVYEAIHKLFDSKE